MIRYLIVLLLVFSCFGPKEPEVVALDFVSSRYFNFSRAQDLTINGVYDKEKKIPLDISEKKIKNNFKFKVLSVKEDGDIFIVSVEVERPNLSVIFKDFLSYRKDHSMEEIHTEIKRRLADQTGAKEKVKELVKLKKHQGEWKVIPD